jgi:DNA-binding response OmpR family regulator
VALLRALAQNPDHFGERDALVLAMGKNPEAYDPRALEVAISRLRQKLGDDPPLKSVRARGYIFAAGLVLLGNA